MKMVRIGKLSLNADAIKADSFKAFCDTYKGRIADLEKAYKDCGGKISESKK